jgi:hypothetical protein
VSATDRSRCTVAEISLSDTHREKWQQLRSVISAVKRGEKPFACLEGKGDQRRSEGQLRE